MAIFTQQYIFDITRFRANQCGLDVKFGYKIRVSNNAVPVDKISV